MDKQKIIIVTGLSGAGMSSSLKSLEDLGYEVFDNFPISLIPALVQDSHHRDTPLAIGVDARTRGFDPDTILKTVHDLTATLLFLSADENTLQKRFTETRRKHPLATDRPISSGIRKELEYLHSLRNAADHLIDTSDLSIHDLRRVLEGHFTLEKSTRLNLTIMSFGFKYGLPREADIALDVRFLRNPHWDKNLKPKTGQDADVANYIEEDDALDGFLQNTKNLIEPLLPRYADEGKSYLTIAIGCTGGRHRSVYCAEHLNAWLNKTQDYFVHLKHRDIDR